MKNKKGFTLIELLAVIVILAIIMVIAVPKILDIIENSRKKAAIESGQLYVRAVDQYMTITDLNQTEYPSFLVDNKEIYSLSDLDAVKVKNKPSSGTVKIQTKKVTKADLCINKYKVTYDKKSSPAWNAVKDDSCSGSSDSKDDDKVTLTCDENIYLNGPVSIEDYNKACKSYIDESLYDISENADGTVNINGFKDRSTVPTFKDSTMALPATIEGKTVASIGNQNNPAFYNVQDVKLILSPTIKEIKELAFVAGDRLTALAVPYSLETIGSSAFSGSSIKTLVLTDNIKSIGVGAFTENPLETLVTGGGFTLVSGMFGEPKDTLVNLTIGSDSLSTEQEIPEAYFSGYTALKNVTIKGNVKKISNTLFDGDTSLTNLKISNGVQIIGDRSLRRTSLTDVTLPNSITSIGEYAFDSTPLTKINLGTGLTSIGSEAFAATLVDVAYSTIDTFTIPDSVTTIGDYIFEGRTINTLKLGKGSSVSSSTISSVAFDNATIKNTIK